MCKVKCEDCNLLLGFDFGVCFCFRACTHSKGEGQRDRVKESQAGSMFALRVEPDGGLDPMTLGIFT